MAEATTNLARLKDAALVPREPEPELLQNHSDLQLCLDDRLESEDHLVAVLEEEKIAASANRKKLIEPEFECFWLRFKSASEAFQATAASFCWSFEEARPVGLHSSF